MNLLTFIWHTFLNDIPKTYTNMKALFTFVIVCITAISLKAQTDSMKLDSTENMISDSSEHHTKKNPEMLNDRSLNTPSEKQNSENKPVPAQAPGTEVLITPTQKATSGSKPAPAIAPTRQDKTSVGTKADTNQQTSPTEEPLQTKPATTPKQKTTIQKADTKSDSNSVTKPVTPRENTRPKKVTDKKDMYLVPDSAVNKIK